MMSLTDKEKKVVRIEDDEWDHYSGLPNPKWYEEKEIDKEIDKVVERGRD